MRICLVLWLIIQSGLSYAQTHKVSPATVNLNAVLSNANAGDTILFSPGRYRVNFHIDKALRLEGEPGAILDGGEQRDVIRIRAPHVVIQGLRIENSGHNLTDLNAGIFVERQATDVTIQNNYFNQNNFGIWMDFAVRTKVLDNKIHGELGRRSQDRGNGIHMYATTHSLIRGNEVWHTRDGIYIDTSNHNILQDNVLHDLRYGVHYMDSHDNRVIGNRTYNTRTGYALMQSKRLTVLNNSSDQDRNYGILMNYITHSTIANNRVTNVQVGSAYVTGGSSIMGAEGKAIFIYNSQFNKIHDNLFGTSDIGIHLTAGSEDNDVYGNNFTGNRVQVKYVSNRLQEWSHNGRGNFWSDYLGWDLNADGVGDKQYEPNDAVDKLLWKYPMARILMSSPAIETLRWVQEQFPVLRPQGVRDSAPLMLSPSIGEANL